jgi:phospholipid/cholesterol/gamma-HCH transport system ATP-binding protein
MTSTFRIAHQAFMLVHGRVVAEGTPDELAYGENEQARAFIAASGVDPDRLSRVNKAAPEADAVIRHGDNAE